MKQSLLIIAFLISSFAGQSTHIVGGNFDLTHISGEKYFIRLIFLFDDINGDRGAKDLSITISFFDKQTNTRLDNFTLDIKSEEVTNTTSNGCDGFTLVRTRIITYSDTILLSSRKYTGKSGFYVAFERCCRNYAINNIQNPGETGMTYYMEQPSPYSSAGQLINSSPRWKSPTQLYACKDKLLTLDFGASDPDGDSLVYYMDDPIAGHTNSSQTFLDYPMAAPYENVNFIAGYSKYNSINGTPSLNIALKTGKLSVKPRETGLFVFAVTCEEYRNGVKIGLVKREIQLVVWECSFPSKPSITGKYKSKSFKQLDTLRIFNKSGNCLDITVTDTLPNSFTYVFADPSTTIGANYSFDVKSGFAYDTLKGKFCIPGCTSISPNVFPVKLSAVNYFCKNSYTDTLSFYIQLYDSAVSVPKISGEYNSVSFKMSDTLKIYNKSGGCIHLQVTDSDSSSFVNTRANISADLANNYSFTLENGNAFDTLKGDLCIPKCFVFPTNAFPVQILATKKLCDITNVDTLGFFIQIFDSVLTFNPETAPNIFTPNNDNFNDLFIINNIPPDNCEEQYLRFEIYNRWGNQVYSNTKRHITWDALNLPDGLYYYYIVFTKQKFKGTVQVLR